MDKADTTRKGLVEELTLIKEKYNTAQKFIGLLFGIIHEILFNMGDSRFFTIWGIVGSLPYGG